MDDLQKDDLNNKAWKTFQKNISSLRLALADLSSKITKRKDDKKIKELKDKMSKL